MVPGSHTFDIVTVTYKYGRTRACATSTGFPQNAISISTVSKSPQKREKINLKINIDSKERKDEMSE